MAAMSAKFLAKAGVLAVHDGAHDDPHDALSLNASSCSLLSVTSIFIACSQSAIKRIMEKEEKLAQRLRWLISRSRQTVRKKRNHVPAKRLKSWG